MKNKLIKLMLSFFAVLLFWSCEKEENKIFITGGTPPVLTANKAAIPLNFATRDNEAIKLTWTNPNYGFTTGISSQDVNYLMEIDTTGSNFSNPGRQSISIARELERTFTQEQLNNYLLNQLLVPGIPHNIEIRITSTLGSNIVPLYSNVLKFTVTPYSIPPKVEPPTNGTLWMTGDAAQSGWSNPLPAPYNVSQSFKKVTNTLYELTVNLPGGGAYKLIQEPGNWSTQYHMIAGGTWDDGDFEKKDSDPGFPGPPSAGSYKITVNFQTGKYKVVKL